jgi:hypothetical protein
MRAIVIDWFVAVAGAGFIDGRATINRKVPTHVAMSTTGKRQLLVQE